jgi:hypothetical protein
MKKILIVLLLICWTLFVNARCGGGGSHASASHVSGEHSVAAHESIETHVSHAYTRGKLSSGSARTVYYVHQENYHPYYNNNMLLWYLIIMNNNTHQYDTLSAKSEEELQQKVYSANGEWDEPSHSDINPLKGFIFLILIIIFAALLFKLIID